MMFFPHLPIALILLQAALCLVTSTASATNHSVDDLNPLFKYSGSWESITKNFNSTGGNQDKDGSHHLATDSPHSSATITYTFASVYFCAPRWPYKVTTNYGIDGNPPMTVDMQDHTVPATPPGGNATVPSQVLARWTSTANKKHTIHVTVPPKGEFAVVDMFIFEVLDPSSTSSTISSTSQSTSSTISSTSQTSSITRTTSRTASSSSSSSSSVTVSHVSQSSKSPIVKQNLSSTVGRDLAISMGVVGTSVAILFIFLLWWFCIRRKDRNGGNMGPITPQYHQISTIPENGTHVPFNDNSISMTSDGGATSHYGFGIQNNNLRPPITLNYDRGSSLYSGQPSTPYTDQSALLPRTQEVDHNPQERISTISMMSDGLPLYCDNPILDESASGSSSSSNGTMINEKTGRSQILANTLPTAVAEPEVNLTSTAIPESHEEIINVWDSGYPQPLRFVPIA